MASTADVLREEVRRRYAESARAVTEGGSGCGCGSGACCDDSHANSTESEKFGEVLYDAEQRGALPEAAVLASLGCGNPTAVADLREGETVLDLGSGGGIDVILSARRVGPTGTAYGLDMTDEMLALAQKNAKDAGVTNVHFLKGFIEQIPLPADSVDVVISNCVINLSTDKAAVLIEIARVLRPGGRLGISDVVAEDHLTEEQQAERGSFVGCIAGALSKSEYEEGLRAVGFEDVEVTFTHEVADGMHGAIVKAVKTKEPERIGLPVIQAATSARLLLTVMRALVAEAIGTFALVFAGAGAIVVDARTHALGHIGIAITFGLVVMAMIYAVGHVSGAHFNPAVSFAFALTRHFPWPRAGAYWIAQLTGALFAALLLRASVGTDAHLGATLPSGSQGQSFVWELVLTFFLMFVIMAVATDTRAVGEAAAIAIGGTVGLDAMFGGPISGASMNPARSVGPALVGADLHALWLYVVAPLIGAAFAGLAYQFVRGEPTRPATEVT
jgi:arsenite methyltransferase